MTSSFFSSFVLLALDFKRNAIVIFLELFSCRYLTESAEHTRILEARKLPVDKHRWTGCRRLHALQNRTSIQSTDSIAKDT